MKVLALVTWTPNCEPFWRSLEALGHKVYVVRYDDRPHDRHGELVDYARSISADLIVFVGAYEPSHGQPVPRPDVLRALREVAPSVLLCGDAADHPWWPVLEEYHRERCFTVIVGMDGQPESPIKNFPEGITLLTPTDHRLFNPPPWEQRTIRFGMIGGAGHRDVQIQSLVARGLDFRPGPGGRSYGEFAQLMCQTKLTINNARTGTGEHMQVKGRVIEAGMAGCCLLEMRGSPTGLWFEPAAEFLEYSDVDEAARVVKTVADSTLRQIAAKFHAKMLAEHHPQIFWSKVLQKTGVW